MHPEPLIKDHDLLRSSGCTLISRKKRRQVFVVGFEIFSVNDELCYNQSALVDLINDLFSRHDRREGFEVTGEV